MIFKKKKTGQSFSLLSGLFIYWTVSFIFRLQNVSGIFSLLLFLFVISFYLPYVLFENFIYYRKSIKINRVVKNPSSPFYKWNIDKMKEGRLFPWDEVIISRPFSKKYLKKPTNIIHTTSRIGYTGTDCDSSLPDKQHYCINEEWICVHYNGHPGKNKYLQQGILTICPKCKKQLTFNGTGLS